MDITRLNISVTIGQFVVPIFRQLQAKSFQLTVFESLKCFWCVANDGEPHFVVIKPVAVEFVVLGPPIVESGNRDGSPLFDVLIEHHIRPGCGDKAPLIAFYIILAKLFEEIVSLSKCEV